MTDLVLSERRGPVALLTLNRPDALNALNSGLLETLADRTAEIAADSTVGAVVLTGAGRAFAAGADIAAMREMTAVEGDIISGRATLAAIKQGLSPEPGGLTVIGRVLRRDGAVPKKAEVVFLSDKNEPVKELGVRKLGTDGMLRTTYKADKVKKLVKEQTRVVAAVRQGGRIVATDETPTRVVLDQIYTFDLRVETALDS